MTQLEAGRSIDTLFNAAQTARTDAQQLLTISRDSMQEAQARLQNGESTGDPLRDLLIVRYGFEAPVFEPRYREVERKVGKHQGEFVLLVRKKEVNYGHTLFGMNPKPSDIILHTTLGLGFLQDDKLVFRADDGSSWDNTTWGVGRGICRFPTRSYARLEEAHGKKPLVIDADLPADLTDLDSELPLKNALNAGFSSDGRPKILEVHIGNQEVTDWFGSRRESDILEAMALQLISPWVVK